MLRIGIVAGGPKELLPIIDDYRSKINYWIGVDRGAYYLLEERIKIDMAIGDFDSVSEAEKQQIQDSVGIFQIFSNEKDETDLQLALEHAYSYKPDEIYLFGVTGGRLDHTLVNIQLLQQIHIKGSTGIIIDEANQIKLTHAGIHKASANKNYSYISFIPFSESVRGLCLDGFKYPLKDAVVRWGDTLCISNELIAESGTYSYDAGILLVIKSRDILNDPTTSSLD